MKVNKAKHLHESKQNGMTNYKLITIPTTKVDRYSKHTLEIASKAGLLLSKETSHKQIRQ